MKSNLLIRMWTMLILGMTFANAALAVPHISPSDGGGSPSAPEPGSIIMIVIGLVVVGGYLLWRQRRRANTTSAK